jgi:hypothetical protein
MRAFIIQPPAKYRLGFRFSRAGKRFLRRYENLRNFDALLVGALSVDCQQNVKSLR